MTDLMKTICLCLFSCIALSMQGSFFSNFWRTKSHRIEKNRIDSSAIVWNSLLDHVSRGDLRAFVLSFGSSKSFVDINKVDDRSGDTLLIRAVESKNVELVKFLMYCGADINKPNSAGSTPLMKAIYSRNIDMINHVLSIQEILLDVKNNFGETALMIASTYGDIAAIEALVAQGVDVTLPDHAGKLAYERLRSLSCDSDEHKEQIRRAQNLLLQTFATQTMKK